MRCETELCSTWRCSNRSRRHSPQHTSSTVSVCGVGVRGGREGKEWKGEGGVGGRKEGVGGRGRSGREERRSGREREEWEGGKKEWEGGKKEWEGEGGVGGRGRSGREERRSGREREEWEGEGGVGGQSEEKALQVVYMNGNMLLSLYLCCTVSEGQYFEPRVCCITNWCSLVRI